MKIWIFTILFSLSCCMPTAFASVHTSTEKATTSLIINQEETPIFPIGKKAKKHKAKKTRKHDGIKATKELPNSFGWTGLVMLIVGGLLALIFGSGIIGSVGAVVAAIGLIFVLVWIIQRLATR